MSKLLHNSITDTIIEGNQGFLDFCYLLVRWNLRWGNNERILRSKIYEQNLLKWLWVGTTGDMDEAQESRNEVQSTAWPSYMICQHVSAHYKKHGS